MKNSSPLLLLLALVVLASCQRDERSAGPRLTPVSFADVTIDDAFWAPRLRAHKDVTIPVCIDQIERQTGRIRNFQNAAQGSGQHSGIFFDDSDVYKALEGMAYSLQNNPDSALEAKCDEWIELFAAAQQPDGYLDTYFILAAPDRRWTNMDLHEMYCAGHLIEAAVAYYKVTGKRRLLDVAERVVAHIMTVFGPDKRHWVPGHEEIELALVKLYDVTANADYLHFADWLLSERGHGHGSYGTPDRSWPAAYYQDDVPVRDMTTITGHAVRSMYLFCGMADVAAHTADQGYRDALDRVWDVVVNRNMYITGGIGQTASNEGFTTDYSLPNRDAYCETCASVGMVLWNWRMNLATGNAKYADVLERALYNGALAGVSLGGDRFFYVNPLESDGTHHRQPWYGCACCPSQICRFLPSIGNYIYALSDRALWVNLFIGNSSPYATIATSYPWSGDVELTLGPSAEGKKEIRIRIPEWNTQPDGLYTATLPSSANSANSFTISASRSIKTRVEDGYLVVRPARGIWGEGDQLNLHLDMPVTLVAADDRVKEDEGCRAVQCGPIVYAMEALDNPTNYADARLTPDTQFHTAYDPFFLGGTQFVLATTPTTSYTLIPYYAWDNRQPSPMRVWIPWE